MIYLWALGSAVLYGAADFTGGLATRRASTIPIVLLSQLSGLVSLLLLMPLLEAATPTRLDMVWGAVAGLTGGIGVALLYRALAIGTMAVVAPTTAVCAVTIPVVVSVVLGERPPPLAVIGIVLGVVSIVLVSRQTTPVEGASAGYSKGVGTALASGVMIGFFFLALAQTHTDAGMWPLVASRSISVLLFGVAAIAGRSTIRMPVPVFGLGHPLRLHRHAGECIVSAWPPGSDHLSIVVTLSSLYPASTVLLARVVLGERLNLWQVSGVGCALAAVVLIVSGS